MTTITTDAPVTRRARLLAATFGLALTHDHRPPEPDPDLVEHIVRLDDHVLITGPSGSGKSILLRAVARRLGVPVTHTPDDDGRALLERLDHPDPLTLLTRLGLGEVPLWFRSLRALSEGQRARAALAFDLARSDTLCVDEFASTLDRLGALALASTLTRRLDLRLVAASAHDDLAPCFPHVVTP